MPVIRLAVRYLTDLAPHDPSGNPVPVPRPQLRCLVKLPGALLPQDGVIDTGAPLTTVPEDLWRPLQAGTDYEWLIFPPGTPTPVGVMAHWRYTFRLARFLAPVTLIDYATAVDRPGVVAAFADSNPPAAGRGLPPVVVGLWGGLLEGGAVAVDRTPGGRVAGELRFP
ncbi:MAG: hypothetical protein C0501_15955 [Isosphaera sp.]|nr:hypothetical protein [Isosphaera sp.]